MLKEIKLFKIFHRSLSSDVYKTCENIKILPNNESFIHNVLLGFEKPSRIKKSFFTFSRCLDLLNNGLIILFFLFRDACVNFNGYFVNLKPCYFLLQVPLLCIASGVEVNR